jgi:hypothetical protein
MVYGTDVDYPMSQPATIMNSMSNSGSRPFVDKEDNGASKLHRLDATSLLRREFVPQHLLAINSLPISATVPTKPAPSLELQTQQVFYGLLGSGNFDTVKPDTASTFSYCSCPGQACQHHPQPTNVENEKSFVAQQIGHRKSTAIPMVDVASSRSEYVAIFRELLQVEYEMTRQLYETYQQFQAKIEPVQSKMAKREGRTGLGSGVACLKIAGLADARPPLQPGDLVLIRPHQGIHLQAFPNAEINLVPFPQRHLSTFSNGAINPSPYPNPYGYSVPSIGMVEIHGRVLSITRGKQTKKKKEIVKDVILISWVVDPIFGAKLRCFPCTVRFIPSTKFHERCLTALQWLTSSISENAARDLLFPSKSPELPPMMGNGRDECSLEEFEDEKLNKNQTRFVQMVLTRTASPSTEGVRPPMILTGPAGTGKTKTTLAAIWQIIRQQLLGQKGVRFRGEVSNDGSSGQTPRILICTPSHTACDVITRRLSKLLAKSGWEHDIRLENNQRSPEKRPQHFLFRLYDVTRNVDSVPIDLLPYTRQDQDGQFVMPSTEEFLGFSIVVCTCQDAHILFLAGLTNATLRQRRHCLQTKIEATLAAAGLLLEGTILGKNQTHFTHLFIDEAAQATEPESCIPLSVVVDDHPGVVKVEIALCGDPRQLSPNIYSPIAFEGLQRSLLERLLRLPVETYGGGRQHMLGPPTSDSWRTMDELIEYSFQKNDCQDHLSVFLNLSYRGHPSFLLVPSKLFYFDKLKCAVNGGITSLAGDPTSENDHGGNPLKWVNAVRRIEALSKPTRHESVVNKPLDWPMHFRGVIGNDKSMAIESFFGSNSWCNNEEAYVVLRMVETLVRMQIGVSTQSIGIIAAFRAQVVLIRRLLREKNLGAVNVGMPEDFQSVECEVIILSLTRSNASLMEADVVSRAGLFHQPKRMNVALTRAEHVLIVVGNPEIMKLDHAWKEWLDFCAENGLWYGESGKI